MQKISYIKWLFIFLLGALSTSAFSSSNILFSSSSTPNKGWMANGWGVLHFNYYNPSPEEMQIQHISATWYVGEDSISSWSQDRQITLNSRDSVSDSFVGWMPTDVVAASEAQNGAIPYLIGTCKITSGQNTINSPFTMEVPIATLDMPTKTMVAKYVSIELETTTWDLLKNPKEILGMLDETYKAMYKLTGNRPYNSANVLFKECPENPYFAYAGNPIVFNEKFVENSAKRMDRGEFDFGWVHELGHDFDDVIGNWYNYGTFTEFMANIKLSYVYETLVTDKKGYKLESWVNKGVFVNGEAFNVEYFLPFGVKYIDSDRTWETLISDEYHAMFYEAIQKYGWKCMKTFFRQYVKLSKSDIERPSTSLEKLELICAVLQNSTPESIIPLYEKYRLPVDDAKLKSINKKYNIK